MECKVSVSAVKILFKRKLIEVNLEIIYSHNISNTTTLHISIIHSFVVEQT